MSLCATKFPPGTVSVALRVPDEMRLLIVIVNYRSAGLVEDCLASLEPELGRLGAPGGASRVVVVENASGEAETLRQIVDANGWGGWCEVMELAENRGFAAGNNAAIRKALTSENPPDFIWLLNPDTLLTGVGLDAVFAWFQRNPDVGAVGMGLLDEHGAPALGGHRDLSPLGEFVGVAGTMRLLRRFAVSDRALDRSGPVDWVSGASMVVRREAIERVGLMDEGFFLYFEEVDWCRRMREAGWRIVYEPKCRIVHLEGAATGKSSRRRNSPYWYKSRQRYFLKHRGRMGLLAADVMWSAGRIIGLIRLRPPRDCRWWDMVKSDLPALVGRASSIRTLPEEPSRA